MKSSPKLYLAILSFLLCLAPVSLSAQHNYIHNFYIIPSNPVAGQDVSVVCESIFPSAGCGLDSISVDILGTQIKAFISHDVGAATTICYSTDTIDLGPLSPGIYSLQYCLNIKYTVGIVDADSLSFTVGATNSVGDPISENALSLYPNPTRDLLNVSFQANKKADVTLAIYDLRGKELISKKVSTLSGVNTHTFSTDLLSAGVYLLRLTSEEGYPQSQKFVKR